VHGDKAAYEMLENVKAHCERKVHELELQLKNKHDVLVAAQAAGGAGNAQQELIPRSESGVQPEVEAKLVRSMTDITEPDGQGDRAAEPGGGERDAAVGGGQGGGRAAGEVRGGGGGA
jgi:hypothetical protein